MQLGVLISCMQAEDVIRYHCMTGVQTCVLLISSRRRHTRSLCDWSSDVCSSDLPEPNTPESMFKIWSGKTGSNRRPQPWQGCALPTELFPHFYRSLTFYNVVCCDGMNCSVVLGGFRKNATFFHLQCLTAGSTGLDSAGGGAAASSSDKGSGTRSSATLRTWSIHLTRSE